MKSALLNLFVLLLAVHAALGACPTASDFHVAKSPSATDQITVGASETLMLSQDLTVRSLTIAGKLYIDCSADVTITADYILINGSSAEFVAGTSTDPMTGQLTIQLRDHYGSHVNGFGSRFLGVDRGSLHMYGDTKTPWTELTATAAAGTNVINVATATSWAVGDKIVIASTDFAYDQMEERTITAVITSTQFELSTALEYPHYAGTYDGIHMAAEVGLLSRSIRVMGTNPEDQEAAKTAGDVAGGQMKALISFTSVQLHRVEFTRMGQMGVLGTYPVHFHMCHDVSSRAEVVGCAVHHNYQRSLTIHDTNGLQVRDNVLYDTFGHSLFLEDGSERDNVIEGNLVLRARDFDNLLLPSDGSAALFWITNPDNIVRNNHAAGSESHAFWYALPEHPMGPSYDASYWNRRVPLGEFSGNVAHSNGGDGLHVDRGPNQDGTLGDAKYEPRADPADEDSAAVWADFADFKAYKCRNQGVWTRGSALRFSGCQFADNAIGITHASQNPGTETTNCVFVGESDNIGQWAGWEEESEKAGRSLPKPWDGDYPIRGVEHYDGPNAFSGITCSRFIPNSQRDAACISVLRENRFQMDIQSSTDDVTVTDNSKMVSFPDRTGDGTLSVYFRDLDGSVVGETGKAVLFGHAFNEIEGCEHNEDWYANVCPEKRHARLMVQNKAMSDKCSWVGDQSDACVEERERVLESHSSSYGDKPTYFLTRAEGNAQVGLIGAPVDCCGLDESDATLPNYQAIVTVALHEEHTLHMSYRMPSDVILYMSDYYDSVNDSVVVGTCYGNTDGIEVRRYPYKIKPWDSLPAPLLELTSDKAELLTADGRDYYYVENGFVYVRVDPGWSGQVYLHHPNANNLDRTTCGISDPSNSSPAAALADQSLLAALF